MNFVNYILRFYTFYPMFKIFFRSLWMFLFNGRLRGPTHNQKMCFDNKQTWKVSTFCVIDLHRFT